MAFVVVPSAEVMLHSNSIEYEVARQGKVDREHLIQLVDESDTVCTKVTKTIHIKQKVE